MAVFRLLIRAGHSGVKAGEIAGAVAAPASTLSANLNILSHAGLIEDRRVGWAIYYAARYDRMRDLLAFLVEDCCNGSPEICAPLVDIAAGATCSAQQGANGEKAQAREPA